MRNKKREDFWEEFWDDFFMWLFLIPPFLLGFLSIILWGLSIL